MILYFRGGEGMMRHLAVFITMAFLLLGGTLVLAQGKGQPMTNADVVKMVQSGTSEEEIIRAIDAATPNFDITDESVAALLAQKVPEKVILAMARRQGPPKLSSRSKKAPKAASPGSRYKWEVEIHGGFMRSSESGGYSLFPSAEEYLLEGSGAQGYKSKRVSTWYIGEGATLLGASTSLQDELIKPIVKPSDKLYGFRVSRSFNKWLGAEFTLDRAGKLELTDEAIAGIKAADANFLKFWQRLNVPGNTEASSSASISPNGGHQTFAIGALVVNLPKAFGMVPYVTGGAGVLITGDKTAGATLEGSYGGPSALETDTLSIAVKRSSNRKLAEMVGFGVKINLTSHVGLRVDARAYFHKNTTTTLVNASHTNTPNAAWVIKATPRTGAPATPDIQRLNGPGVQSYSTLSGPAISNLKTYYGYGTQRTIPVSIGLFYRF